MNFSCGVCGMKFRSYQKEARHRHNIPVMCSRAGLRAMGIYPGYRKEDQKQGPGNNDTGRRNASRETNDRGNAAPA